MYKSPTQTLHKVELEDTTEAGRVRDVGGMGTRAAHVQQGYSQRETGQGGEPNSGQTELAQSWKQSAQGSTGAGLGWHPRRSRTRRRLGRSRKDGGANGGEIRAEGARRRKGQVENASWWSRLWRYAGARAGRLGARGHVGKDGGGVGGGERGAKLVDSAAL